jgi:hypothetical protein
LVTLKEKHRLMALENRVLRKIFESNADKITGDWKRLHNEEPYGLYSSPKIMRVINSMRMRWSGRVARLGDRNGACRDLVVRPEKKLPLGRSRHSWEGYSKMCLVQVGWNCLRIGSGGRLL